MNQKLRPIEVAKPVTRKVGIKRSREAGASCLSVPQSSFI
jgi:hypothetical protein